MSKPRANHSPGYQRAKRAWKGARDRCFNSRSKDYPNYGGRGISMTIAWSNFFVFMVDMGECPKGMTLGRKNNDRGYYPDNCRWETPKQQANNRRSNRIVTIDGRTMTAAQWADALGVNRTAFMQRLDRALTGSRLTRPQTTRWKKGGKCVG